MHVLPKLVLVELKLRLREKLTLPLAVALPLAVLAVFGSMPGSRTPDPKLGGQSGAAYVAAIGIGVAIASLALNLVPSVLGDYREKGVLRRLRATPVRPGSLIAAQVIVFALAAVVGTATTVAVGRLAFGVPLPAHPLGFAAAVTLCTVALFSLGMVLAAVAPSGTAAGGIGMLLFFPSLFLAGVYVPREQLPALARTVGDVTPLGAGLKALRDAWTGGGASPSHLLVLAGYAVVMGVLAARVFRWE